VKLTPHLRSSLTHNHLTMPILGVVVGVGLVKGKGGGVGEGHGNGEEAAWPRVMKLSRNCCLSARDWWS
jgi:hypothetical protein